MRQLLKFLHTMGAIGLMGAMASLIALAHTAPPPTDLAAYAAVRSAMGAIATWIFFPSLGFTLIAGLIALAASTVYQNAGWAWAKAVSGVLIFESGLIGILGPMQREAERAAQVLASNGDAATVAVSPGGETGPLWVLLAVATANVVLGIWRPSLVWKVK